MDLIYTSSKPLQPDKSFADCFMDLMGDADHIKLATGYISEDSLLFLLENFQKNKILRCNLIIGMHAFEGFTKTQYTIAKTLGFFLNKTKRGSVSICTAFPYHGKFYCFYKDYTAFSLITGSANLTQVIPTRQRNFSVKITDAGMLADINKYYNNLNKHCESVLTWKPKQFQKKNSLLKDCINVKKVSIEEYTAILKTQNPLSFKLPLKAEKKSNLNVCFGKGRENTEKGIIKPRSWYEFEVIVDKSITSKKGYPRNRRFNVITDDCWEFECKTQGDYSKNFRSTGGLAILGMWVKGRLQDSGVVCPGDFITAEMLEKFGKKYLQLTATNNTNIWLLSF